MHDETMTSDALLHHLVHRDEQEKSNSIYVLFCGLEASDANLITTILRAQNLAPRCRHLEGRAQFKTALGERTWDLLILGPQCFIDSSQAHQLIEDMDKRLSIIQLIPEYDPARIARCLESHANAVISLSNTELLSTLLIKELQAHRLRTELHHSHLLLNYMEKRCQQLVESSSEPIALCSPKRLINCNAVFAKVMGYARPDDLLNTIDDPSKMAIATEQQALYRQLQAFSANPMDEDKLAHTFFRADGTRFKVHLRLQQTFTVGEPLLQLTLLGTQTDKQTVFANQDPITGLYNREFLLDMMARLLSATLAGKEDWNLFYLQLDNFRNIRAETGLEGCDLIARDIADILRQSVSPAHTLARLSDDTFIVLFMDADSDHAQTLATRLCDQIYQHTAQTKDAGLHTSCSIGIVPVTENAPHLEALLERARLTTASLSAQHPVSGGVKLYHPEPPKSAPDKGILVQLDHALKEDRLRLLFQPIVPLCSDPASIGHYEVLLRLINPQGEEISPNLFLTSLENAELCNRIDRWVIRNALEQMRKELDAGYHHRLFISLSGQTLIDRECPQWLAEHLRRLRLPAENLVFQISENDLSQFASAARSFIQALKAMHCLTCIKHYGSSAQSGLLCEDLPVDYIKLDGAFVQELESGKEGAYQELQRLIQQPQVIDTIKIAPHVEKTRAMSQLWKAGIHYIQGFYLQPPREKMDYDFFE